MRYSIEQIQDRYTADKKTIGTKEYKGSAYFWNYEYRHYLRDATDRQRKTVHNKFLREGLDLDGISDKHLEIIRKVTKLN